MINRPSTTDDRVRVAAPAPPVDPRETRSTTWARIGATGIAVLALLIGLIPMPVKADASSADLAVAVSVIDDLSDPQVVRVRITNLGPTDSDHPIATVALDAGHIVDHTADPLPASRDDGVGCAVVESATTLSCSWDRIPANASEAFDVRVGIDAPTVLTVQVVPAGTPDPNPVVNNRGSVRLTPPVADLSITDVEVSAVNAPTAHQPGLIAPSASTRVSVSITVAHLGGRETSADLHVMPDRRVDVSGPCAREGLGWTCALGDLAPDGSTTAVVELDRPEPDDDPITLDLLASVSDLLDPDPDGATTTVTVLPRVKRPGEVVRHAGAERIATAIAISRARYRSGEARAVVLARSDTFADALAGGPLAVDVDGPILLTAPGQLSAATAAEIDRVLRTGATVHLLGGVAALSTDVEEAVRGAGYRVARIAGLNRYGTAVSIWEALDRPRTVAVADGDTHPDAVVAGSAMAAVGGALLLTAGTVVPPELDPVRSQVDWAVGMSASRAIPETIALRGSTSAATGVAVARAFFDGPDTVGLATAAQFPDALAGGPLAAGLAAPLLLTDGERLSPEVVDYLRDTTTVTTAHLLGGTAALDAGIERDVTDLIAR